MFLKKNIEKNTEKNLENRTIKLNKMYFGLFLQYKLPVLFLR